MPAWAVAYLAQQQPLHFTAQVLLLLLLYLLWVHLLAATLTIITLHSCPRVRSTLLTTAYYLLLTTSCLLLTTYCLLLTTYYLQLPSSKEHTPRFKFAAAGQQEVSYLHYDLN